MNDSLRTASAPAGAATTAAAAAAGYVLIITLLNRFLICISTRPIAWPEHRIYKAAWSRFLHSRHACTQLHARDTRRVVWISWQLLDDQPRSRRGEAEGAVPRSVGTLSRIFTSPRTNQSLPRPCILVSPHISSSIRHVCASVRSRIQPVLRSEQSERERERERE